MSLTYTGTFSKAVVTAKWRETFAMTNTTEMLFVLHFHTVYLSWLSIFLLFNMVNYRKEGTWAGQRAAVRAAQFYTWAGDVGPVQQSIFIFHSIMELWNNGNYGLFHSGSISQLAPSLLSQALCSWKSGLFREMLLMWAQFHPVNT